MKDLEYGKGYRYAHDEPKAVAAMSCLPPSLEGRLYYTPTTRGFEKEIGRRLAAWRRIKNERRAAAEAASGRRDTTSPPSGAEDD